jgi:transposase
MTSDKKATRRRYSREFKAQVIGECDVAGASVSTVAMSHGINTNVVHGWRKLLRAGGSPKSLPSGEFVPVVVKPGCVQPTVERPVEVELRRGALVMKVTWPISASEEFAAWTRELLR